MIQDVLGQRIQKYISVRNNKSSRLYVLTKGRSLVRRWMIVYFMLFADLKK